VDLGAGTARPGLAHHPEIVLLVAIDDVDVRVQADAAELFGPEAPGFLVAFGGVVFGLVRLVDGGVDALRRKFPDFDDEFPRQLMAPA